MGKKVYSSGLSASDLADDRPRNQGTNMAQMSGRVSAPPVDDGTRAQAALYTHESGNRDVWEALGLEEYAERRRVALGLATARGPKSTAQSFACPTCGAAQQAPCRDSNAGVMSRCHVARNRALKVWLKDTDEGDQQ